MIAMLRSWLMPAGRRPRHAHPTARPVTEALETRAVLSGSIAANIGGLMPPVVSLTLPQPTGSGAQDVTLILRPSADDPQLIRDSLIGKILHKVNITLSDGKHGKDTIHLRNAVITSYQVIQNPNQEEPSIAVTFEGRTSHTGSITANIDGVTPPVVSLMIPQPKSSGVQDVTLVVKVTKGVAKLFQDAVTGKVIPEVEITLNRMGNGSTETISLTSVLISSIQFSANGDIPTANVTLEGLQETIRRS